MEETRVDSQFHDISFEGLEDLIEECTEVEVPLESFQEYVNEVNGYEKDLTDEIIENFLYCERFVNIGNYAECQE